MEIQLDGKVRLGEGGYGSVFPGTFKGRKVAVKRVLLLDATSSDHEGNVIEMLNHPNIVKRFHYETDDNFKYIALELCAASLNQLFLRPDHPKKYNGPKLPHSSTVFSQLASGLEFIHSSNLVHRDIKPENVLIFVDSTNGVTIKWAGFGLSKPVKERGTFSMNSGITGMTNWYAPELLKLVSQFQQSKQPRGTVKSDVFAQGLVFAYLLLDGQHLYGSNNFEISTNIMASKPVKINEIDPSHYALKIITKMLEYEACDRISSCDVVNLLQYAKEKLAKKERELRLLCNDKSLKLNTIELLIETGIDVNGKDEDGSNALHYLCQNNSGEGLLDAMKFLINFGIDINGKNKEERNALHLLCRFNSSEKLIDGIYLLIQLGIDVNEKDEDGSNALLLLCQFHSTVKVIDIIKVLTQLGIDVNGKNKDERNALHLLCRFNSSKRLIEVIKLLIQLGIHVKEKDKDGNTALHLLCANNSSENIINVIKFLIQVGIDVNDENENGSNALHYLCQFNSSERLIDAIKLLVQHGIDVKSKDKNGSNALHYLCKFNSREILNDAIELLVQLGIDVNEKDNCGSNALHYLCQYNSGERLIDPIKLLILLGIDVKSNEIDARFLLRENFSFYYRKETVEEIIKLLDRAAIV